MQQSNFQPENLGGPDSLGGTKIPENLGGPDSLGGTKIPENLGGPDNLGGPKISTNSLNFGTLQTASSKTLEETLTNPNNGTLIWNVSITYGSGWAGWLSLNLSSGTIPANGNQDLSVTANTSALTPGTYNATLNFSGNFSPQEQVAVTLAVQ